MHVILYERKTLYMQYICSNLEDDFILFLQLHTANRSTSGFSSSSLFVCEKLVQVVYWKECDKLLVIGLPEEK